MNKANKRPHELTASDMPKECERIRLESGQKPGTGVEVKLELKDKHIQSAKKLTPVDSTTNTMPKIC
eukprot:3141397-Amphidinium_carterae.1